MLVEWKSSIYILRLRKMPSRMIMSHLLFAYDKPVIHDLGGGRLHELSHVFFLFWKNIFQCHQCVLSCMILEASNTVA